MRVLVVEDDAKVRSLLRRGLEHEGYTVRTQGASDDATSSGQLAFLVVSASKPDEVLADFTRSNPQGRLITPDEVAAAVTWLCSSQAGSVTGVALPVAGGEV